MDDATKPELSQAATANVFQSILDWINKGGLSKLFAATQSVQSALSRPVEEINSSLRWFRILIMILFFLLIVTVVFSIVAFVYAYRAYLKLSQLTPSTVI